MTKHDYKQNAYYMLYLIRCVLNNKIPSKEKLDKMNLSQLYSVAQAHSLTAITAYALESAGKIDENFKQAKNKAIRRTMLFEIERTAVVTELEKVGIWYVPLKGIIIKDYYPKVSMREMGDNDLLFDCNYREQVKKIMESLGFSTELYNSLYDDVYYKPPICNFEMHVSLFDKNNNDPMYCYFKNIDQRLISDNKSEYGRQFTIEDFYLYIKAHEYKHFSISGTGLRNLIDTYLFVKKYYTELDWDYLDSVLNRLGILDYERNSRSLAENLFSGVGLNEADKELLDHYIFSGTYGTFENHITNKLNRMNNNIVAYILERVFVPIDDVKKSFPTFYKYPILLPLLPLYRILHNFKINKSNYLIELKTLINK